MSNINLDLRYFNIAELSPSQTQIFWNINLSTICMFKPFMQRCILSTIFKVNIILTTKMIHAWTVPFWNKVIHAQKLCCFLANLWMQIFLLDAYGIISWRHIICTWFCFEGMILCLWNKVRIKVDVIYQAVDIECNLS